MRPGGLGYIGRMKRTASLAAALVLAACAAVPTVDGAYAQTQVEVDSHLLLGDIALERQDRETAAREFLAVRAHVEELELEGGGAEVGDQNEHCRAATFYLAAGLPAVLVSLAVNVGKPAANYIEDPPPPAP